MLFVHGSYLNSDKYILDLPDVIEEIETIRKNNFKIEFFGHTHMKVVFIETEGALTITDKWMELNPNRIYIINPGSVGQPRDKEQFASYLIFDPIKYRILYRKITYNIDNTIKKMQKAGFPPFTYNRLRLGI